MVDDKLLAAIKEVGEFHGAVGTSESVILVHFDHGEVAELGIENVVGA